MYIYLYFFRGEREMACCFKYRFYISDTTCTTSVLGNFIATATSSRYLGGIMVEKPQETKADINPSISVLFFIYKNNVFNIVEL